MPLEPTHDNVVLRLAEDKVLGVLLTWHSALLRGCAEASQLLSGCGDPDDICTAVKGLPGVWQAFQDFRNQVVRWCRQLQFSVHACAFEVCTHNLDEIKVHMHAWFSVEIGKTRYVKDKLLGEVDGNLEWRGFRPHSNPCVPRGRAKHAPLIAGGLYYVLCNKIGSLFRSGSHWPFQERISDGSCGLRSSAV